LFKLRFLGKALKDLERIDLPHRLIIKEKLLILAENPAALRINIKRLGGEKENLFRLRVGKYRIIFRSDAGELTILIIRIGHRKEIYS
jgi:mRNA interferase RelE/StbE